MWSILRLCSTPTTWHFLQFFQKPFVVLLLLNKADSEGVYFAELPAPALRLRLEAIQFCNGVKDACEMADCISSQRRECKKKQDRKTYAQ